jgi:hypothetical protein
MTSNSTLPYVAWKSSANKRGLEANIWSKSRRLGVVEKFFNSCSVIDNEIGPAVYRNYLAEALLLGKHIPVPPPVVAGHGLEAIQKGLELLRQGVSAKKIVLTM